MNIRALSLIIVFNVLATLTNNAMKADEKSSDDAKEPIDMEVSSDGEDQDDDAAPLYEEYAKIEKKSAQPFEQQAQQLMQTAQQFREYARQYAIDADAFSQLAEQKHLPILKTYAQGYDENVYICTCYAEQCEREAEPYTKSAEPFNRHAQEFIHYAKTHHKGTFIKDFITLYGEYALRIRCVALIVEENSPHNIWPKALPQKNLCSLLVALCNSNDDTEACTMLNTPNFICMPECLDAALYLGVRKGYVTFVDNLLATSCAKLTAQVLTCSLVEAIKRKNKDIFKVFITKKSVRMRVDKSILQEATPAEWQDADYIKLLQSRPKKSRK